MRARASEGREHMDIQNRVSTVVVIRLFALATHAALFGVLSACVAPPSSSGATGSVTTALTSSADPVVAAVAGTTVASIPAATPPPTRPAPPERLPEPTNGDFALLAALSSLYPPSATPDIILVKAEGPKGAEKSISGSSFS